MLARSKVFCVLVAIMFMGIIAGCKGNVKLTDDATPEDIRRLAYYQVLRTVNNIQEDYLDTYDRSDKTMQAKMKAQVDPLFRKAKTALKAWGVSIGNTTEYEKKVAYEEAYNELLALLLEFGVLKLKEVN